MEGSIKRWKRRIKLADKIKAGSYQTIKEMACEMTGDEGDGLSQWWCAKDLPTRRAPYDNGSSLTEQYSLVSCY